MFWNSSYVKGINEIPFLLMCISQGHNLMDYFNSMTTLSRHLLLCNYFLIQNEVEQIRYEVQYHDKAMIHFMNSNTFQLTKDMCNYNRLWWFLVFTTLYLQFEDQIMNENKFFPMSLSFCHFPTQPDVRPILVISIHESQGTN